MTNPLCADGRHTPGCLGLLKVSPYPGHYGFCSCTPRAQPPPDRRPLCPACRAEVARWHDVRPSSLSGIPLASIGQNNPDNVIRANRARLGDYYALVRRQERLIRDGCRAGRHARAR